MVSMATFSCSKMLQNGHLTKQVVFEYILKVSTCPTSSNNAWYWPENSQKMQLITKETVNSKIVFAEKFKLSAYVILSRLFVVTLYCTQKNSALNNFSWTLLKFKILFMVARSECEWVRIFPVYFDAMSLSPLFRNGPKLVKP